MKKDNIGCGTHLEGWTSVFVCGNLDKFTGKLLLCSKCKKKFTTNNLVEGYNIINNFFISPWLKLIILVISLYSFSQVYQGRILTFIGISGCIWVFESFIYEYRLTKLENYAKDKKEVIKK